ncbi:MAG: S9 family peptidase [Streptosporangiaceae bacterium]
MEPFADLDEYVAIPRVNSLRLAPDGAWLAAEVQTLDADRKKYVTSIWRIDPGGATPARLTRSEQGESGPGFLPDGSLLFVSKRPGETGRGEPGEPDRGPGLWLLPPGGGEARQVAAPPGGVAGLAVARNAQEYLLAAAAFAGTTSFEQDAARRKARSDADVRAILHEAGPVRHWDHDLGPAQVRLYGGRAAGTPGGPDEALTDLTPDPGRALEDASFALTPDGSAAVTSWRVTDAPDSPRSEVVVLAAGSARRVLMAAPGHDFGSPLVSPDGRQVLAIRSEHDSYDRPGDVTLVLTDLAGDGAGQVRDLLAGFDRRPESAAWAPDSAAIYFTADDRGRRPIYRVDVAGAGPVQVTTDDAAYDQVCPAPDGTALYALRASISEPPAPVRIDLTVSGAAPVRLPSPTGALALPGQVEEVTAAAPDGTAIRGWLVLPAGASASAPAPLLLWVHGGPVSSWNSWSWRWNPWLMAARGYAVLLPDPALSTGYGQDFIARGHGMWGQAPFTDVLAVTDAVVARPDIDAGRTAMMGGSFGGYMANWIAGHTDRFAAIVSHAGLWALDQMFATTDMPPFWRRSFADPLTRPERYLANSPHLHADAISTPLLLIHGDRDYRVPIGEALRMYADLAARGKDVKFLYFPDENHWILRPGDARLWYETVLAFLDVHVLGEKWVRPDLL